MCYYNLNQKDNFLSSRYSLQKNAFVTKEDESFDTIYSSKELEYPLYFTFHQLLNHVHSSYKNTIHEYTKKQILELMEDALDTH